MSAEKTRQDEELVPPADMHSNAGVLWRMRRIEKQLGDCHAREAADRKFFDAQVAKVRELERRARESSDPILAEVLDIQRDALPAYESVLDQLQSEIRSLEELYEHCRQQVSTWPKESD